MFARPDSFRLCNPLVQNPSTRVLQHSPLPHHASPVTITPVQIVGHACFQKPISSRASECGAGEPCQKQVMSVNAERRAASTTADTDSASGKSTASYSMYRKLQDRHLDTLQVSGASCLEFALTAGEFCQNYMYRPLWALPIAHAEHATSPLA
jgi:hypothetical protein